MRNTFAREITAIAAENRSVVLLSGDIGNKLFDDYKKVAPDRFYNCGVAEANMIGVAAGMALTGLRPVTYTITSFATVRCLEQIRVDLCYHDLPVLIVGTGSGLSYTELGPTHHSCEDVGLLRMLPNMTIVCPCDPSETRLAVRAAMSWEGPVYLRLGKKGEPAIHPSPPDFRIGRSITVRAGSDACILSTGSVMSLSLEAADLLLERGIAARVESFHTVKPLDAERLGEIHGRYAVMATVEEHSRIGGLGGAVAEWMSDQPRRNTRLLRFGTADRFLDEVGSQRYGRRRHGLTKERIADGIALALADRT